MTLLSLLKTLASLLILLTLLVIIKTFKWVSADLFKSRKPGKEEQCVESQHELERGSDPEPRSAE